jgi:hypothetical protein
VVLAVDEIHASFFTLLGSATGLVLSGIGLLLSWRHPGTGLPVEFESIGALILAVAVSTHFTHLSMRVGRFGVGVGVASLYVWAASWIPFALNSKRYLMIGWQQYFYCCWGLALAFFAITTFLALLIKEGNEELDIQDPFKKIHITFTSLLFVAAGLLVFSIGFFDMAAHLNGERLSWALQFVGPLLISWGLISHLEHLTKHLGFNGAILGVSSALIWAACSLPFAIKPILAFDSTWGLRISNGLFSLPYFLTAATLVAVALRKRSLKISTSIE